MKAHLDKLQTRKNSVSKFSSQLTRLATALLITFLLTPTVYFGGWQKVSAGSRLPVAPARAPVSATPETFAFSSPSQSPNASLASVGAAVTQSLANGYRSISDSIIPPAPPEGFAAAKVPTVWQNISNPISAFVSSSVAALFFISSATTTMTEAVAPLAPAPGVGKFDFDADGKADVARWQSASGEWKIRNSSNGGISTFTLATSSTSVIAPADYDGDTKTDYAVLNTSTATWTIKRSSDGAAQTITGLGQPGDRVVSGKYDGDGLADAAVYNPSSGNWYVKQSSTGTIVYTTFGASSDVPAPGDYDGDGLMDYAVFRPSAGGFYVKYNSTGSVAFFQWGISTDTPVPGDYDNDGKTDFAVYRPSTRTWYVNRSDGNPFIWKTWGNYGDQPAPADYDNDGKDDFAVWRPTTGVWYIVKSSDATLNSYEYQTLGAAGDVPVESAYVKQIGAPVQSYGLAKARLQPRNQTGGTNLYSQNFSWGTSLVNLPGRAGLDAGFGISYNSLVWTKQFGTMIFDADNSNVSPGFRFVFPVIEPSYYDSQTGKFAYLMVTPSGGRIEFRQDAASGIYETADSTYTQL